MQPHHASSSPQIQHSCQLQTIAETLAMATAVMPTSVRPLILALLAARTDSHYRKHSSSSSPACSQSVMAWAVDSWHYEDTMLVSIVTSQLRYLEMQDSVQGTPILIAQVLQGLTTAGILTCSRSLSKTSLISDTTASSSFSWTTLQGLQQATPQCQEECSL